MQFKVIGEKPLTVHLQALIEKIKEFESDYAIHHSRGVTLYINPTNGHGDDVEPRQGGRKVEKIVSDGPYKSAADDFKL
jgi:hypothetical protein